MHGASATLRPGIVAGGIAPLVVPYRIGIETSELGCLLVAKALFKKLEAFLPLLSGNPVLGSPEGLVIKISRKTRSLGYGMQGFCAIIITDGI